MENLSPQEFIKEFKSKYGEMALDDASALLEVVRDGKIPNDEENEIIDKFISKYGEMAYYDMINFLDEMVLSDKMAFSDVIDFLDEMAFNNKQQKQQDEIIIKCSLEEIANAFFKDYEIIWHDPNVNCDENKQYLEQLEKICKVQTFTEWKEAEDYIKTAKTICHVITSGTNGELLVKEIFSSQNVPKIFTFCRNEDYHSTWTKNYDRILCTEITIEGVVTQIQKNLLEWQKQTSSLKFDLPAFAPIFNDKHKSKMNHLHHYLKVIPNFKNRMKAKEDIITLSRGVYSDKKNEKLIADFEKVYNEYNKEVILKWYTQQSFLYKVVNNCLRIATSDSIQWSRFLLKDIERAIKDQYQTKSKSFSGLLYRAAYLSEKEWLSLKRNMNREIEMHGFLSVSKEKSVALKFMGVDPAQKVFVTIIVPKCPFEEEQGFAEIDEFSKFPKEKEVLFNVRSRFLVLETEDEYSGDLPYRHLVLFYGAQGLRQYITEENPVQHVSIENVEKILCSHCETSSGEMPKKILFMSLADPEKRIYSCQKCLSDDAASPFLCIPLTEKVLSTIEIKGCLSMSPSPTKIPLYGYQCSKCEVKNQEKYFVCTDCGEREKRWCQNCFENILGCAELGHSIILESYPLSFWCEKMSENELHHLKFQNHLVADFEGEFQQAGMYFKTHEYKKLFDYYNLYLEQNEAKGQEWKVEMIYHNIGTIYVQQGKYQKALEYALKALNIHRSVYGENDPEIANSYVSLGLAYQGLGEYNKALKYLLKALNIKKSALGQNHPNVAASYGDIGSIYNAQGEYEKALEYHLKALDISESIHRKPHPDIAISFGNIGETYRDQGKYLKALEYYLKALDIYRLLYGENDPDVAGSYDKIGSMYFRQGEFKKALEYHLKALDIGESVLGENHLSLANFYDNIGGISGKQGEYKKALEYHLKALNIRESVLEESHPNIATSYDNIASVYKSQGEYKKALEYFLKALEIRKLIHGKDHPDIANSYMNIGNVYSLMAEYKVALIYHLKSLEIKRIFHGENNPETAESYNNLASAYNDQGEHKLALEYHLKSLEIKKIVFGENNPSIADSYNNIALVYGEQGEYPKALEYYSKALDIFRSVFEENNPSMAICLQNIALVYDKKREYAKAIEYYLRSLDIQKLIHGENHAFVAAALHNIGLIYKRSGQFQESLEYSLKSIGILKSLHGQNHADVATGYCNLGNLYHRWGKSQKAHKYLLKSLKINKSIYGENHPEVAHSYHYIGIVYQSQKEYQKAIEYLLKSLYTLKSASGENHNEVVSLYNEIAMIYESQGEFQKVLEYLNQSLDILKSVYGGKHLEIVPLYNNIAKIYESQGEYKTVLENLFKSLDVLKSVYGENHLEIVPSYNNIAMVYESQREYQKAREFFLKSLNISRSAYGENHLLTAILNYKVTSIVERGAGSNL